MWPCVFKCTRRFFLFVWPISRVRARRRPKLLFTKQELAWRCLQWDLFPLWLAANFFFSKKRQTDDKKISPLRSSPSAPSLPHNCCSKWKPVWKWDMTPPLDWGELGVF